MHYFNELRGLFQMVQVLYSIVYNNVHDFRLIIYFCTMIIFFFVSKCVIYVFILYRKVSCSIYSVFILYVQLGGGGEMMILAVHKKLL